MRPNKTYPLVTLALATIALVLPVMSQSIRLSGGTEIQRRVISATMGYPGALVVDPTGALWATERNTGRVLRIDPTTGDATTVLEIPITSRPDMPEVTGGVFGIAVHHQFQSGKPYVYVSTTTANDTLVVERYRYLAGSLIEKKVIFTAGAVPHSMGLTMEAMPDGSLLIAVASFDTFEPARLDNVNGKIIRVDEDGNAHSSNPWYETSAPSSAQSYIYTWGHRNPLGLTHIGTEHPSLGGAVYSTECGPNSYDELNKLQGGGNYGWLRTAGYCEGTQGDLSCPLATLNQAPAGIAYYHSAAVPEWTHSILMGTLRGNGLAVAQLTENGVVKNIDATRPSDDVLVTSDGNMIDLGIDGSTPRVIDVAVSKDGRVYAALYEGGDIRRGQIIALENPAVHSPLSVTEEKHLHSGLSVAPIPAIDVLTLTLEHPFEQSWTASVVDLSGSTLSTVSYSARTQRVAIPVNSLASGAYLLVVRSAGATRSIAFVR